MLSSEFAEAGDNIEESKAIQAAVNLYKVIDGFESRITNVTIIDG